MLSPEAPSRYDLHQRDAQRELRRIGAWPQESALFKIEAMAMDLQHWHQEAVWWRMAAARLQWERDEAEKILAAQAARVLEDAQQKLGE